MVRTGEKRGDGRSGEEMEGEGSRGEIFDFLLLVIRFIL
jgi:hypothetical protein